VGWINDATFAVIVKTMSDRMARGDVPINLTVTPLIANAYLYTGDEKYKRWITRYVTGWVERTRANNGITPDNVGLNGRVGEHMSGNWWGGYYGWKWPRGGIDIVRATITAAKAAHLLTGDKSWFDLPRSQVALIRKQGRMENGKWTVPARYDQRGWYGYGPEPAYPYAWMWLHTFDDGDWREIDRLSQQRAARNELDVPWVEYLNGRNPGYPLQAMTEDLSQIRSAVERIRNEHSDPETFIDSKWASMDPLLVENLLRLTMGAPQIDLRGEMLHARLRYFDPVRKRPGLPPDVAALISRMTAQETVVELVNTGAFEQRSVVIQGGAYGEHEIVRAGDIPVGGSAFAVNLAPGAGITLKLAMKCWSRKPSFAWPPLEVAK
jgi:hypothetical protein